MHTNGCRTGIVFLLLVCRDVDSRHYSFRYHRILHAPYISHYILYVLFIPRAVEYFMFCYVLKFFLRFFFPAVHNAQCTFVFVDIHFLSGRTHDTYICRIHIGRQTQ